MGGESGISVVSVGVVLIRGGRDGGGLNMAGRNAWDDRTESRIGPIHHRAGYLNSKVIDLTEGEGFQGRRGNGLERRLRSGGTSEEVCLSKERIQPPA